MTREKMSTPVPVKKRAPRKAAAKTETKISSFSHFTGPEARAALIAQAAYFRALKRGFAPGHEQEDWLAAEAEVDAGLLKPESAPRV